MAPFVFVTVGTDFHMFNRLIATMDAWAESRAVAPDRCFLQYGASDPPGVCSGTAFLSQDKLRAAFSMADVVVSHGGPATIAEARAAGVLPICMPRDPARGEHVDEHQLRFSRRLARDNVVILAEEDQQLMAALDRACADPDSVAMSLDWSHRSPGGLAVDQVGGLIEGLLSRTSRIRRV